jgi:hypothetical protein
MAIYISTVITLLISIFTAHVYSSCFQGKLESQVTSMLLNYNEILYFISILNTRIW